MRKMKILLLMLSLLGCMECTGCGEKNPASEQGEFVQTERLPDCYWRNPAVFLSKVFTFK